MSKDSVNHPTHYNSGKIEVIEAIEDWVPGESHGVAFHLGNAVKYVARAGKKDPAKTVEDLEKAIWYIRRAIAVIQGNPPRPNEMPQERAEKPAQPIKAESVVEALNYYRCHLCNAEHHIYSICPKQGIK